MISPESHAKAVAAARIYLHERGFKMLDHAVPYADFVGIDDGGNRLIFVGSMGDPDDAYDYCDYLMTIHRDATVLDLWAEV